MLINSNYTFQNTTFQANPFKNLKRFKVNKFKNQTIDTFEKVPKGLTKTNKKQHKLPIRAAMDQEEAQKVTMSTAGAESATGLSTLSTVG